MVENRLLSRRARCPASRRSAVISSPGCQGRRRSTNSLCTCWTPVTSISPKRTSGPAFSLSVRSMASASWSTTARRSPGVGQRVAAGFGLLHEPGLGVQDGLRHRRRARRDAQLRHAGQRQVGIRRGDFDRHIAQPVAGPRVDFEHDLHRLGGRIDREVDLRVVVAFRAQRLVQARAVILGAPPQPGQAGRRPVDQSPRLGHLVQQVAQRRVLDAFDRELVGHF